MNAHHRALPPLPCACANLRRAARALTQFYERELRHAGLNMPQFTLLQALAIAGTVTQRDLARLLVLDSTTLSRTLRPLEEKRWIRSRTGEDRRERQIELTSAGRAKLHLARPFWNRAQRRLVAAIGGARLETLVGELSRVARLAGS